MWLILELFWCGAHAQTLGVIGGRVVDADGAIVAGAALTLANEATGGKRDAVTDGSGQYLFPQLGIGLYSLGLKKEGFTGQRRDGIRLGVGESVTADFVLSPGAITETIEVRAEAALAETNGAHRSAVIGRRPLADLPINGRDYARFSLLTPGAVARSALVADLTFNGFQTVHNQFTIDGIEAGRVDQPFMANGNERGAKLLTGSLDAIAEFRVETANYQAQYGRAAGAWISIVTRSGSNRPHASTYGYFRNDALDARNFFNVRPRPRAKLRYGDFGVNASGPLRRNRTFVFANYEGARRHVGVTAAGTVPSAELRGRVLSSSAALRPVIEMMPFGDTRTTNPLVDDYTTTQMLVVREDTGSVRLDQNFSERNSLMLRVNFNDSRVTGPLYAVNVGAFGLLDRQDVPIRTTNAAASHQLLIGAHAVNSFTVGMQRWASFVDASAPALPLFLITGLTIRPGGRGSGLANNTSYQVGDTLSLASGSHLWKFGASVRQPRLVRRTSPFTILVYTSLDDFAANRLFAATVSQGNPGSSVREWQFDVFAQDTWRVRPRFTLDYGVRYDYASPPFDPAAKARPFDTRVGALGAPGASFFRPNRRNFAPRLGLAWQASERLVVRAGYGIFFQIYPPGPGAAIAANDLPGNTNLLGQQIPDLSFPVDRFVVFGSSATPAAAGFEWEKPDLYAQHWSLSLAAALGAADVFELAYVGNRGVHLRRPMNFNLLDPGTGRRPHPAFANINIETATGNSSYHALQSSWRRRMHSGLECAFHYTIAHAIDDVSDQGIFTATPQDNRNLRAERGNSSQDVRHVVSGTAIWQVPVRRGWFGRVFGASRLAVVVSARSGVAANVLIGVNTSGNGNPANQRPDAVAGISPYVAPRSVDRWLNLAAFQLPSQGTFGNLGRNTVYGPLLTQIDAAWIRDFRVPGTASAQFRLEVFNVLNHPNFAQPNLIHGDSAFGRIFDTLGHSVGPGTARQLQLALRFHF